MSDEPGFGTTKERCTLASSDILTLSYVQGILLTRGIGSSSSNFVPLSFLLHAQSSFLKIRRFGSKGELYANTEA